jgi:hypothetical protein
MHTNTHICTYTYIYIYIYIYIYREREREREGGEREQDCISLRRLQEMGEGNRMLEIRKY